MNLRELTEHHAAMLEIARAQLGVFSRGSLEHIAYTALVTDNKVTKSALELAADAAARTAEVLPPPRSTATGEFRP